MNRVVALMAHLSALLVGGTGLVYAWMLFLVEPTDDGEFGVALVNHPWQPQTLALHVLLAPLLVFVIGYLWPVHVMARLRTGSPRGRVTGALLVLLFIPMLASGYLLQVSVDETWRERWSLVHLVSSLLWCLLYAAHPFLARRGKAAEFAWEIDPAEDGVGEG